MVWIQRVGRQGVIMSRLRACLSWGRRTIREAVAPRPPHRRRLVDLSAELALRLEEMEALRRQTALLRDEFARLRTGAQELPVARNNKQALAVGRQSLLDYRVQAALAGDAGEGDAGDYRRARGLYLDLLEAALTGCLTEDPAHSRSAEPGYDSKLRMVGWDWPKTAQTMIGVVRMRNLRHLLERVIADGVPGDLIETGVWRGGACIYMRGILAAHGIGDRTVWVADSFRGLPPPDETAFPQDRGDTHHTHAELAIPLETVRRNFERYGLLDSQVRFLEGWFKDTLPTAPVERLAILRLDGDMYESTIEALDALYHKVSPGGFVIIDDYILPRCRQAVHDFRARHNITAELEAVDGVAVFWRVPPAGEGAVPA